MPVLQHYDFEKMRKAGVIEPVGSKVRIAGKLCNLDIATLMFAAANVLKDEYPMTVRQVYYQLFSKGFVNNSQNSYRQVVNALVKARQMGVVPWEKIEDRVRKPRTVGMWSDLPEFLEAVKRSYRRNVWDNQDVYVECWLEKDALSGIFEDQLRTYGVTLNVGRGYDGWSSIKEAATRLMRYADAGKEVVVLYSGDFDPSGLQMEDSLRERLAYFGFDADRWERLAVTNEDITEYDLPEEPGKRADPRANYMIDKVGRLVQVELDALPLRILRDRIATTIESIMDMDLFEECEQEQSDEQERLDALIEGF